VDKFVIEGPTPLAGTVRVEGAKNAVLPLMAAALLARGKSVISNVPDLRDVSTMVNMLDLLGAKTTRDGDVLTIDSTEANGIEAPYDLVRTMRASIYVLAPTLAVHGRARVSMPGGCAWGPRPIDLHLMAMEKLGARIELAHGYIEARCDRLRGGEVVFPISSVGATVQTIMAASLAEGTTVIENAAREPEISNLADCLVTLPGLLRRGATDSLHFWFSTFDGLRRELFPRLVEAYSRVGAGDTAILAAAAEAGRIHFAALGLRLLGMDEAVIEALSHEAGAIAL